MRRVGGLVSAGLLATFVAIFPLGASSTDGNLIWLPDVMIDAIAEDVVSTGVVNKIKASPVLSPEGYEPGDKFRDSLRAGGHGPEMVVIPAGRFLMGCLSDDSACEDDETPVREVVIARPFALSVYEVTFEDYERFSYPDGVNETDADGDRLPVTDVEWDEVQGYLRWLSEETGEAYRLPSEAEWEYAARAGTSTKYSWGNEIGVNRTNCANFEPEGPGNCGEPWEGTAPVGSFVPNAWGLHDMHGNVSEWVADCWNGSYVGAPTDGSVWRGGDCELHVIRGGDFGGRPAELRAAERESNLVGRSLDRREDGSLGLSRFITVSSNGLGFRVARSLRL